MDSSLNSNEIATLSLLQSRGFGGGQGGYGYGVGSGGYGGSMLGAGNSVLAAEAHANGTASDAKLQNLTDANRLAFDSNQEQIRESRTLDQFSRLSDNQFRAEIRGSDQHASILKGMTDVEFRSLDRQRDIEALLVQNAKDAAACCCDAKLEACKSTAEVKALVIQENSATRELIRGDALAAANAELTALKTQIACGCCNSPS